MINYITVLIPKFSVVPPKMIFIPLKNTGIKAFMKLTLVVLGVSRESPGNPPKFIEYLHSLEFVRWDKSV